MRPGPSTGGVPRRAVPAAGVAAIAATAAAGRPFEETSMSRIGRRLEELGLVLPEPPCLPPGAVLPSPRVNARGRRAWISGHGPLEPDGSITGPFGRVGEEVEVERAVELARLTALAVLGSLRRALGGLDRIAGWARAHDMVACAPDFAGTPRVIGGFTEVILAVSGEEVGRHARSAVGMTALPFRMAVEIEAEVILRR